MSKQVNFKKNLAEHLQKAKEAAEKEDYHKTFMELSFAYAYAEAGNLAFTRKQRKVIAKIIFRPLGSSRVIL